MSNARLKSSMKNPSGFLLYETAISDDATVVVSSTYITDTYEYYDVLFHDLIPATDAQFFRCRFGVGGTVYGGSTDYNYGVFQFGHNQSDNQEFGSGVDNGSTAILLTHFANLGLLGTGTGEVYNGHYRFYNLRSTTFYKGVTVMDSFGFASNEYFTTIRKGLMLGSSNINRTNKVDTLEFAFNSGNIASATMSVYGWKK